MALVVIKDEHFLNIFTKQTTKVIETKTYFNRFDRVKCSLSF